MPTYTFCEPCVDDYCAPGALPLGLNYTGGYCEATGDDLIDELFYTDAGHPLVGDPALAASWATRLSNTSDGTGTGAGNPVNPIRSLKVPKFTRPRVDGAFTKSIDGKRSKSQKVERSVTGLIDDDSDAMFAMMLKLQCNGNVIFWYRSGKHIYGGKGIPASFRPAYGILDEDGFKHKWGLSIVWDERCDEPRVLAAI